MASFPEPLTYQEAHEIHRKARRGYRATPEETERLAYMAMLAGLDAHVCMSEDIEQAAGLDR